MTIVASFLVPILLLVGMFYYMPRRMNDLLGIKRRRLLYIFNAVLIIAATSTVSLVSKFSSKWIDLSYLLLTATLGFLLYIFIFQIIYDLTRRFINIKGKKAASLIIVLALTVSSYGIWNGYQFYTTENIIKITGLKSPLRVAVMADVQLGGHRGKDYMEKVVDATNAMNADIILIPGDIADSNAILEEENFASLSKLNAPSYFILGNHDIYIDTDKLLDILKKNNINIMIDDLVETHGISLLGLNYMKADDHGFDLHASEEKETIKTVLEKIELPQDNPVIVMHHSPLGSEYVRKAGGDLYIAGHTHAGGQVFPITLISKWFFYEYVSGLYDHNGMPVFVSPGVGTFNLPMRIGTDNELNLLLLEPKDNIID